jgi:hypothetical protein
MMVYDPIANRFTPFGYLKQAALGALSVRRFVHHH